MAEKALTTQSEVELDVALADGKRELFNLRFQLATGQLESPARIKAVKREVARIKTEQRARQLAEES